jgi:hypothetical protein
MTDNGPINEWIRGGGHGPQPLPEETPPAVDPRAEIQERRDVRAAWLVSRGMNEADAQIKAEEAIPMPAAATGVRPADFGGGARGSSVLTGRAISGSDIIREAVRRSRTGGRARIDIDALGREMAEGR